VTTAQQNKLLTETGPGTPAGNLLRRYWQAVALARELEPDTPLPVQVMGEALVLFRDPSGHPGILGRACPHRCADLSYGRVENGGLRCLYHGWLMDIRGRCLEQPAEPAKSTYKDEIRHTAYPCKEAAGVIFAYMGPGEPPIFPGFHFLTAPEAHVFQSKVHHRCNYLQANEGNIDPAHLSFLHAFHKPESNRTAEYRKFQQTMLDNRCPAITTDRTRFGLRVYAERRAGEREKYLRITNFVFPNVAFFAGQGGRQGPGGYSVHWHVPIDDASHWRFDFVYHPREPLDKQTLQMRVTEEVDENYFPRRTPENRYLQDRREMSDLSFSGMGTYFPAHDLFAVQSPGAILDRAREHLATSDTAIVAARRMLLDGITKIQRGEEPPFVIRNPDENVFADIVVTGALIETGISARNYCQSLISGGDFHAWDRRRVETAVEA
jgi:phenylpropionate dioxygenase-like ring-hydroxylating dioxygenase large terminal subunit